MASSMVPMHLFSQDNQSEMQHLKWCWHHMIFMASKMTLLHSLGQDSLHKAQHNNLVTDTIDTGISVTSANSIINDTTAFLRLRQLKWDATSLFCQVIPLPSTVHHMFQLALVSG